MVSVIAWVLALVVTAVAASFQGTVGLGFAMISVPTLTLIHPSLAPVPQLLIAIPLTISMAWRERHAIDLHGFWWLIGGRIPGAFMGLGLLAIASQRVLDAFIGIVVLGVVVAIRTGFRVKRTPATKLVAGIASGTTGVVASIGGPPAALVYASEESATIRSTLGVVFTIGVLMSTAFRFFSGNISWVDIRVSVILLPAVLVGYLISGALVDRFDKAQVRSAILIVSALAAVALLIRAIFI